MVYIKRSSFKNYEKTNKELPEQKQAVDWIKSAFRGAKVVAIRKLD